MRYNKLVRDKVPDNIRQSGGTPVTHVAVGAEYRNALRRKLQEEVDEYGKLRLLEELADVMEVLYALAQLDGFGPEQLEGERQRKLAYAGGFEKRIILEEA